MYDAVEGYISTTYNRAPAQQRNAVGFVMTIYRRRLASSFHALQRTLEKHLRAIAGHGAASNPLDLEEALDGAIEGNESNMYDAGALEQAALALEESADIERLLDMIRRLPPDTKSERLREVVASLRADDYGQVMVCSPSSPTPWTSCESR